MRSRHAGRWAAALGISGVFVLMLSAWRPGSAPAPASQVVWTASQGDIPPLAEIEGEVERVDATLGLLTLRVGERRTRFRVTSESTVFLAGRTAHLAELSPGERVRATYAPGRWIPLANWVERVERPKQARRLRVH